MAKYGNRKTRTSDGIVHDSAREARRWTQLLILERAGEISGLRRQVEFILIPDQREPSTEVYQRGEKKGMPKEGKLIERKCSYVADFVYTDADGKRVVEDVKGYRDPSSAGYAKFVLKRKMMLWLYGIRIMEV